MVPHCSPSCNPGLIVAKPSEIIVPNYFPSNLEVLPFSSLLGIFFPVCKSVCEYVCVSLGKILSPAKRKTLLHLNEAEKE